MTIPLEYYQNLPTKRMGAGALLLNSNQEILLLKPTYKSVWEIPGGVVEANESPRQCCQREVLEELGVNLEILDLLLLDYNRATREKTESLMFVFTASDLTANVISRFRPDDSEIAKFQFFASDKLPPELTASLRRRIKLAFSQRAKLKPAYVENIVSDKT